MRHLLKSLAVGAVTCAALISASVAHAATLKLATDSGAKGSGAGNAIDAWAEKIRTRSNGEIEVQVFYQNELGGQQEVFDLLMAGDVDLILNWPMTSYEPKVALLYTPYMFTEWTDALAAYSPNGWLYNAMTGIYENQGLKFLGAWPEGFNGVGTKGGAATTLEAAQKFKVRVPPVSPFAETVAALGYQTATIDWGELYSAIQTGVVDGDAANVIFYDLTYFGDVLTDWTYTRQQFITGILTANSESLEKLTDEQREIVTTAAREVMEKQFADARSADEANVEAWKAKGLNYVVPTDAEVTQLKSVVREKVWPVMDKLVGEELMGLVRSNAR